MASRILRVKTANGASLTNLTLRWNTSVLIPESNMGSAKRTLGVVSKMMSQEEFTPCAGEAILRMEATTANAQRTRRASGISACPSRPSEAF